MADTDMIPIIGAVICQELGIDTDEVEVDTDLRGFGLNSLTALMITVKLHEDHGIDLGPGTLKENYSLELLRKALYGRNLAAATTKDEIQKPDRPSSVHAVRFVDIPSSPGTTTSNSAKTSSSPESIFARATCISQPESVVTQVMDIIATEMETDQSEFAETVEWANLGLDSIMSLAICGRLREELDMEIESTVFAEYESVGAFKEYLGSM